MDYGYETALNGHKEEEWYKGKQKIGNFMKLVFHTTKLCMEPIETIMTL
jgi:hypothetical protein